MQVSLENTANLERRLTVTLPAEQLEGVVGNRLRELARTSNIKGFRPGKVPTKVIEQRFGRQVRSEAYGELVRQSFSDAVRKENLQIAGNPDIKADPASDGEIRYTATFEVVPDFGDIDVSTLEITRIKASIEDADIDTMIGTLRQQRVQWEAVERAAQAGDLVMIETSTVAGDVRVPAEGVERGATVLGSNTLIPALESQLAGLAAGDERTLDVAFPAEWRNTDIAGKTASVSVKILKVSEPKLPEVDAAFVQSFGVRSGDIGQFRDEVRANLERELKGTLMARLREEVAQKLIAAYGNVELPARLIEAEARGLANAAAEQARQRGQDVKMMPENFMVPARNRVAAGLLVGELARRNGMKLDGKRLNETMQLIASTYEEPQQVIELYRNDANLMANLQNRVMEEQVIDWIAERANSTEQVMSFAEVMRPA